MAKSPRTTLADKVKQKRIIKKKKPMTIGEKFQLERKTRSGLETRTLNMLDTYGVQYLYEPKELRVDYTVPEKNSKYLPDIVIGKYYFELKGYISDLSTRMKYLYVAEQNPHIELIMVLQKPDLKITKQSRTTYKDWFEGKGIKCLDLKQFDKLMKDYRDTGKVNLNVLLA